MATAKKAAAKKAVPKKTAKKTASKKVAAKKAAPRKAAPKKAAPEKAAMKAAGFVFTAICKSENNMVLGTSATRQGAILIARAHKTGDARYHTTDVI